MQGADFDAMCEREQLQAVLAYVGSDQHLYTCGVNRAFRTHYHKKRSIAADDAGELNDQPRCCCITSVEAVFASASCLRMAVQCGFELQTPTFRAGQHASIETLATAKQLGLLLGETVCSGAASSGRLQKLRWLVEDQRVTLPGGIAWYAAKSGSVEMMQWLHQKGIRVDYRTMAAAAGSNIHTTLVQYLHELGTPLSDYAAQCAAENCNLEMLKWIVEHYVIEDWHRVTGAAADCGSIDILDWLVNEKGIAADSTALCRAAGAGQLGGMEWLIQHGYEVTTKVCQYAACNGGWDENTAALEWLRTNGHLILHEDLYCFVRRLRKSSENVSYIHVWKWLREVAECPWNAPKLARHAAEDDCLVALQYVHQHGGLVDAEGLADQLKTACEAGSFSSAEFLLAQGAAWPDIVRVLAPDVSTTALADAPVWTFEHSTITWAQAHGFTGTVTQWHPE